LHLNIKNEYNFHLNVRIPTQGLHKECRH